MNDRWIATGESEMKLTIATPSRLLLEEEVDQIIIPGRFGYFGILRDHAPFLTRLGDGILEYYQDGKSKICTIFRGFVEVSENHVIVLADRAELPGEIDVERAQTSRQRATQRLSGKSLSEIESVDFHRAQMSMMRALFRLQAHEMVAPQH